MADHLFFPPSSTRSVVRRPDSVAHTEPRGSLANSPSHRASRAVAAEPFHRHQHEEQPAGHRDAHRPSFATSAGLRSLDAKVEEVLGEMKALKEEVKKQGRDMLQELKKHEHAPLRIPVPMSAPAAGPKLAKAATFNHGHGRSPAGTQGPVRVHSDISIKQANQQPNFIKGTSHTKAPSPTQERSRPNTAETPTLPDEPRWPLKAPDEKPPLLPFEVPEQPVVEEHQLKSTPKDISEAKRLEVQAGHADAAAGGVRTVKVIGEDEESIMDISEPSELSDTVSPSGWLEAATWTKPRQRRLSLSVDTCRRSKKGAKEQKKTLRQMTAKDLLASTRFDNFIGALILINAVTIGAQTNYAATNVTEEYPKVFVILERVFLLVFSVELGLRIYVHRRKFFCARKNLLWNLFDFTVVVMQVAEEIVNLVPQPEDAEGGGISANDLLLVRILRILRIVRILRVVRVLHLISELRTIVSSIVGSFKSLGWTVLLLALMIYIVSVYFTQSTTAHMVTLRGNQLSENDEQLQYYFGSLPRTSLSLWQAISGGADWDSMAGPLIFQISALQGVLFAAYIAFALLALMNVVTGVFVQTALQSAKDEEDAFLVDQIVKLFDWAERSQTAKISLAEIEERLNDPAVAQEWKSINVQPAEAEYLFTLLDIEECGEISFQEFLSGCLRLHGHSKSMDVLTIMQENRSASRLWQQTNARWDEFHCTVIANQEELLKDVHGCMGMMARSVDSTTKVDAASSALQDASTKVDAAALAMQEKMNRLEKKFKSFETAINEVRWLIGSNFSKVSDLLAPPPPPTGVSYRLPPEGMSNTLYTIDEV